MKQTKRFYEAPAMQVVELKHRQMLLAGSTPGGSSTEDLEDENEPLFP